MATAVQEESSDSMQPCNLRGIVRTLNRPVSTVYKMPRNILRGCSYKISHLQEFLLADLTAREAFALEFLTPMEVFNEWPWKIFWTEKVLFHLKELVKAQNC